MVLYYYLFFGPRKFTISLRNNNVENKHLFAIDRIIQTSYSDDLSLSSFPSQFANMAVGALNRDIIFIELKSNGHSFCFSILRKTRTRMFDRDVTS